MKRRKMDTPTSPRDPSSSSPAATDTRWVILNCHACGYPGDRGVRVIADAESVAQSSTSTGRHFRVSMGLAPPPAWSYLYHAMVGSSAPSAAEDDDDVYAMVGSGAPSAVENDDDAGSSDRSRSPPPAASRRGRPTDLSQVVAAHGDSVLFQMTTRDGADYFIYRAGGGGGATRSRPPLLTLLPGGPALNLCNTGLLRRGEDGELLVAQLEVPFGEPRDTAELCVLNVGGGGARFSSGWELNEVVPIVQAHGSGEVHALPNWWQTVAVIPVGDRYLCWLNYHTGFLVCDMADKAESPPKIRYIRLPADLVGDDDEEEEANDEYTRTYGERPSLKWSRNMCAAGADAVRLVSVDSRCCCGGRVPQLSVCKRSRFAFTVTTWTLKLRTTSTTEEPMAAWVQDGVLDCDELWELPEYKGLPRVPLEYPIVSADDPDVVCFRVRSDYSRYDKHGKEWMLKVDTRRKRLRSVLPTAIPLSKMDSDNIQAQFHY